MKDENVMDNKPESPGKLSTKAATPGRSTTSSTTEPNSNDENKSGKTVPFDAKAQELFLDQIARGNSPALICHRFGFSIDELERVSHEDKDFQQRWRRADEQLGLNIASALYQNAMRGSVPAQTFWLKNHPPPGWTEEMVNQLSPELEDLAKRDNEELIEILRSLAPYTTDSGAGGIESSSDEIRARCFSEVSED